MLKKVTAQQWIDSSDLRVSDDCENCHRLAKQIARLSLVVRAIAGKAPDNVRGETKEC